MRGYHYSTTKQLPERMLFELADLLALQLHERLGARVYMLPRSDVTELIMPFIDDLTFEDQRTVSWMIWHLFQDALELELEDER
jgi:hypothetical protein